MGVLNYSRLRREVIGLGPQDLAVRMGSDEQFSWRLELHDRGHWSVKRRPSTLKSWDEQVWSMTICKYSDAMVRWMADQGLVTLEGRVATAVTS